jgi:hypothetical protein
MRAASRASGVQVRIPTQPEWPEQLVKAFKDFGPVHAHGAALAWLGHIDLLKLVIQNGWSSALILEDDVDWDIAIRNQTRHVAAAVLALTGGIESGQTPYGLNWDVLWMGHCSDPADSNKPMIVYPDHTVGPMDEYRGLNNHITTVIGEGQRCVHYSENAVCTFAYAVSAQGALKILRLASLGQGGAFDLMLMNACRKKGITCVSVNPEIFDPYRPAEGELSEVRAADRNESVDSLIGDGIGTTDNIRRSARCFGLFESSCRPS